MVGVSSIPIIKFDSIWWHPDWATEDREMNYKNRATIDDLTELGKKAMGFLDY
jgi:hypothetical protein